MAFVLTYCIALFNRSGGDVNFFINANRNGFTSNAPSGVFAECWVSTVSLTVHTDYSPSLWPDVWLLNWSGSLEVMTPICVNTVCIYISLSSNPFTHVSLVLCIFVSVHPFVAPTCLLLCLQPSEVLHVLYTDSQQNITICGLSAMGFACLLFRIKHAMYT